MLHRLPVGDLRLGMFIVSLECSWLQNPFWRSRFLLSDASEIARMIGAGIEYVTIDDALGIGLVTAEPSRPELPVDGVDAEILIERRAGTRPRAPRQSELDRARKTVERSKLAVTAMFEEARLGHALQIAKVAPLVEEIAASMTRDRSAILNVTRLKTKDEYTYLHSVAVCALMMNFARQLGLPEDEVRHLGIAGLLHDVGKMAMPEQVLGKPGQLDEDERRIIMSHPEVGHRLLAQNADAHAVTLDVCLHHHERVDGTGYPEGLTGDQLSLHARMGAICDVYDAITSHRPYKAPWTPSDALAKMASWTGHFDERLLRAFIASIGIFPIGGLVRLHSNRLGLVVAADDASPTTPTVRAFYDIVAARFAALEDVATHNAAGGDPILRAERGDQWFGADWPIVFARITAGDTIPSIGLPKDSPEPVLAMGARA